jgi:hypothetical protein
VKLQDEGGDRSVELLPVSWEARRAGGGDGRLVIDAAVDDGERRWTLTDACLTGGEARDLAAWLAGLAEDTTAAADDWTSLTFDANVVSMSGRRIPGGTVELRIAVLRMRTAGTGTTDVVVGLRTPQSAVTSAARSLLSELDALPADPAS